MPTATRPLTNAQWTRLQPYWRACPDIYVGHAVRSRLLVEAGVWIARAVAPWRQWPAKYGKWNSVYRRYAAWYDRGLWARLRPFAQDDPDLSAVRLDSTMVRAHVSAVGAPSNQGPDPARGRSRGGFGTKVHRMSDRRSRPLALRLTGGQRHDSTQARALVEAWTAAPLSRLIADRAYDVDTFRDWLTQRGIQAVIPSRAGRLDPPPCDPEAYSARNAVERSCGWLKGWRRVATRYDKHAPRCLGFLYLAGTWNWLKLNIHTA